MDIILVFVVVLLFWALPESVQSLFLALCSQIQAYVKNGDQVLYSDNNVSWEKWEEDR